MDLLVPCLVMSCDEWMDGWSGMGIGRTMSKIRIGMAGGAIYEWTWDAMGDEFVMG